MKTNPALLSSFLQLYLDKQAYIEHDTPTVVVYFRLSPLAASSRLIYLLYDSGNRQCRRYPENDEEALKSDFTPANHDHKYI